MNKALHVFIYLFLVGVGVALWYEYQLNDKRTELKDRNRLFEDHLVHMVPLIEVGNDYEPAENPQIMIDSDDPNDHTKVEPNMEDLLEDLDDYNMSFEKTDHNLVSWGEGEREKLRDPYVWELDEKGRKVFKMDGMEKLKRGSSEDLLLIELEKSLASQKDQLKKTREALPVLRAKIKEVAEKYNAVTPVLRQTIAKTIEQKAQIDDLTAKNTALTEKQVELENQIKEKELEIVSLRDEVETAKNETEVVKEELDKAQKMIELLKKQIQDLIAQQRQAGVNTQAGSAISSLPFGDKGKVVLANNEFKFAVLELTPAAMKELKGDDLSRPLPLLELAIKRPDYQGPAGELIGRVRLRQEVPDKNYVICDILTNWEQAPLEIGDIAFSE